MIIIPPVELTIPDDIIYTNVPADVIPPPEVADEARYQMFAAVSNKITESSTNIIVKIQPTESWNTIMLFNVGADSIYVKITGSITWEYSEDIRYETPLSSELLNKPNICILTPLASAGDVLEVRLNVASFRTVYCEFLSVGTRHNIGLTCYGTTTGIVDFSRKDRDEFGNITLIERGYNDTVNYKFEIITNDIAYARELLASRRAKPTGYLGTENNLATYVFGLFEDFSIPIEAFSVSTADLSVTSVVRTGTINYKTPDLQAAFVDPTISELTCIDQVEMQGVFKTLYLDDGYALVGQSARVMVPIGREPLPGETIEWAIVWGDPEEIVGEDQEEYTDPAEIIGDPLVLKTECDEWIATFIWPRFGLTDDTKLLENVASISLSFTDAEQTVQTSNAVTLIISNADVPCTPETVSAAWWNEATQSYDTSAVYGVVALTDLRAIATVFDTDYYLATYPDVAAAVASGEFEHAYDHYWHHGDSENRKPNPYFDPVYYKSTNPDVVAETWPNEPTYFQNSLQHYQMFGYGEGRLPASQAVLSTAPIAPVGEFYWHARVGTDQCSGGDCWVVWEWEFTGENLPKIEIAGDTVVVCAEVVPSEPELEPVSPGVLTLNPFIQCPAESEDLPLPERIALAPITLTLLKFDTGWDSGGSIPEWLLVSESLSGTWNAVVEGDLTECTVSWNIVWSGDQEFVPTFSSNPTTGVLTVSGVTEPGIVAAQATVTGRHGSVALEKIYLKLGGYVFDLMEEIQPPAGECLDPTWKDGTTLAIGYVRVV